MQEIAENLLTHAAMIKAPSESPLAHDTDAVLCCACFGVLMQELAENPLAHAAVTRPPMSWRKAETGKVCDDQLGA